MQIDVDRLAEPLDRLVKVVADLQRQPMAACRQLHVDYVLPVAKVDPRRRARNGGAGREAVGVDGDMVVAEVRATLGDGTRGHRGNLKVLGAELEPHRTLSL